MMRVLLTVTGSWGTGSFQVAKGVAQALRAKGHQAKVFFPDSYVSSTDLDHYYSQPDCYEIWRFPLEKDGIRLNTFPLMLPDPNPRSPDAKTFHQLTADERQLYFSALKQKLQQVIDAFKPDVIECQHIWAMDHVIGKLGYPYVSVAHNSDQMAFRFDDQMHEVTKHSVAEARYIFAVSDSVKTNVIELYGADPKKIITMPCGFDQSVFKPMELDRKQVLSEFDITVPDHAKLIAFAGKMSRTKGIDVLLQANRLLAKNREIHLLIMGSGNVDDVLTPEERSKSCFDRVHFLGHQVPQALAKINNVCDLAVVPSRSEGFCIAGLEAVACGTPVVLTEPSAVGHYAAAAIVPSESPQKLADSFLHLLGLPKADYQQLCRVAIESAQHFTWDRIADQRLQYYQQMI